MSTKRSKVRILHIIGQLHGGGCERQLLGMCRRMDPERFDLTVCWYGPMEHELDEEFRRAGVRTIFFNKFAMPLWRFFLRLRRTVREVDPDIVHTWLTSANFWGRWAALTCGVPHLVASERTEVKRPNRVARLSERLLAGKSHRLANSEIVAASVERFYGLPANRIRIVHNAVALEPSDPARARRRIREELGVSEETRLVVMVGHLREQKNHGMFLRVGRRICSARSDVIFAAIGSGPLEQALTAATRELDVGDRVRFMGERADVPVWLAAADLFCFTTNYEGFPNAVLEAMLAGLPVVTTRFPGLDEVTRGNPVAVAVPLDDDAEMAREIDRLLDDPAGAEELGRRARRWVGSRFAWEPLIETMESFYLDLVEDRAKPVPA